MFDGEWQDAGTIESLQHAGEFAARFAGEEPAPGMTGHAEDEGDR